MPVLVDTVEALIAQGESATVEFKVAAPRSVDLAERLCGFANAKRGGTLIVGVADETWAIVGVKSATETIDLILRAARLCKPVVPLDPPEPQVMTVRGRTLVVAHVPPNTGQLYQAGGVCWLRRGTHTIPLDVAEIERYLYSGGVLPWESQPVVTATLDDLDMRRVDAFLAQRPRRSRSHDVPRLLVNIGCAVTQTDASGESIIRPTQAGMLLFGYAPQDFILHAEIVCVLYHDTLGLRRFADRRILHGTLSEQIDGAEAWLKHHIAIPAHIEGFHRVDVPDYPLEALREAVINAIAHRDYSIAGTAIRIFFYQDRITIHNPGVLLRDIHLDDLRRGVVESRPRNPIIASVLRDLPGGYMERMGTGIAFMINEMVALGRPEPEFSERGEFSVTFTGRAPTETPARRGATQATLFVEAEAQIGDGVSSRLRQGDRQALALQYIREHGRITNLDYRRLTGVSTRTAFRDLEALVERGIVQAVGSNKARYYTQ